MPDGLRGPFPRVGVDGVDGSSLRRTTDHDHRGRGAAELVGVLVGQVEGGEDQAVDEPVLEIADERELVVVVGSGRVEQKPEVARASDVLDRGDHRRVDGVADVGHREGDLAGSPRRSERAAAFGT